MSYLSELHGLKHRARVLMSVGLFFSLANIILPGLAWTVLPQSWDFVLIEGVLGTYYHNYIQWMTDDGSVSSKMSFQKSTHGRYSWRCVHCQLSAAVSWSHFYLKVRNFLCPAVAMRMPWGCSKPSSGLIVVGRWKSFPWVSIESHRAASLINIPPPIKFAD